jgi:hypothetical protein
MQVVSYPQGWYRYRNSFVYTGTRYQYLYIRFLALWIKGLNTNNYIPRYRYKQLILCSPENILFDVFHEIYQSRNERLISIGNVPYRTLFADFLYQYRFISALGLVSFFVKLKLKIEVFFYPIAIFYRSTVSLQL